MSDDWRKFATTASQEKDSEKLRALIDELIQTLGLALKGLTRNMTATYGSLSYPIHGFCMSDHSPFDISKNVRAGVYSYRCYGNKHRFTVKESEIPHFQTENAKSWEKFLREHPVQL